MTPLGKHAIRLNTYGNPEQPIGRHRANMVERGIGLIPLGDRDRAKPEYGLFDVVEERLNNDVHAFRGF